jgi:hypothetical protein
MFSAGRSGLAMSRSQGAAALGHGLFSRPARFQLLGDAFRQFSVAFGVGVDGVGLQRRVGENGGENAFDQRQLFFVGQLGVDRRIG